MKLKTAYTILKSTAVEFNEDNVLRLSAALAYYAIFSIGPLLAIVVGLAGLAFGDDNVRQHVQHSLQGMLGEASAKTVDSMMASRQTSKSLITTIIGIVTLLFGAAGVFGQLQDSLNTIWEVKSKPGSGIWFYVRARFLSLTMILGVGFLLLVSLALSTAISALTEKLNDVIALGGVIAHCIDFLVSLGIVSALFAMIFKYLPDVRVPWRKVWVGAIGTAVLFAIGKFLLALYLGRASTASAYGAAGSVIVILLWIYYSSVILLFGAEFTQIYARETGTKIVPARYAVLVNQEQRDEEGIPGDLGRPERPLNRPSPAPAFRRGKAHHPPRFVVREEEPEPKTANRVWLALATGVIAGTILGPKLFRPTPKPRKKWF